MSDVVAERLDEFAEDKHPGCENEEPDLSPCIGPRRCAPEKGVHEQTVPEQRPMREGRLENRICAPRL